MGSTNFGSLYYLLSSLFQRLLLFWSYTGIRIWCLTLCVFGKYHLSRRLSSYDSRLCSESETCPTLVEVFIHSAITFQIGNRKLVLLVMILLNSLRPSGEYISRDCVFLQSPPPRFCPTTGYNGKCGSSLRSDFLSSLISS